MPVYDDLPKDGQADQAATESARKWERVLTGTPDLLHKIAVIAFDVDAMRDPEQAYEFRAKVSENEETRKMYETLSAHHEYRLFRRLATEAAERTGGDADRMMDPDNWSQEDKEAFHMAFNQLMSLRIERYQNSNYVQALRALNEASSALDVTAEIPDEYTIEEIICMCFFAMNPDIRPSDTGGFTEAYKEKLLDLAERYEAFMIEYFGSKEAAVSANEADFGEALEKFIAKENPDEAPLIMAKSIRIKETDLPLDKLNATIWGMLESAMKRGKDGQIAAFPIQVQKNGSKTPVVVQYAISFDDLEKNTPGLTFTRKLTPYEKRIYIAAGALWNAKGHHPFTYSELYAAAGYIGRPGGNDTDKIDAALTKMNGAKIYVDNVEESGAYNYPHFRYDGSLLPLERVSIIENGKAVDAAIHLFREPPLISYAKEHKQITTISVKLLQSPLSKTDANILLEDYFLDRIARAKNERHKWEKRRCHTQKDRDDKAKALEKNVRILMNTLYEKTGITTLKQRQRAPEKIKKLLDHYKAEKFIGEYRIDDASITITLP